MAENKRVQPLLMDSWGAPGTACFPASSGGNFTSLWTRIFGAALNLPVVIVELILRSVCFYLALRVMYQRSVPARW